MGTISEKHTPPIHSDDPTSDTLRSAGVEHANSRWQGDETQGPRASSISVPKTSHGGLQTYPKSSTRERDTDSTAGPIYHSDNRPESPKYSGPLGREQDPEHGGRGVEEHARSVPHAEARDTAREGKSESKDGTQDTTEPQSSLERPMGS